MTTKVTKTTWRETKKFIKGVFTLNDKTKTNFEIEKSSGAWSQWGNTTENLCISVPKVEAIVHTFIYDAN